MEQRPLPEDAFGTQVLDEPHLELVPALDDPEVEEEQDEAEEDVVVAEGAAAPTQDPLKLYVRSIGGGPLLTRAEEADLARRKDDGDEEAKRRLIEANLRLPLATPPKTH